MDGARPELITDDALDDLEREAIGRVRGRVLEIGAGEGANFGAFHDDVEWIGLEPDFDRRVELAQQARAWQHAREPLDAVAESIPLPDGSVDAVVGTYVLCSVRDQGVALAEVRRVLRPGGRLLVTVPYHGRAKAALIALTRFDTHFDPLGQHLRFYTRRSLATALEATGFERIHAARFAPGALKARAVRG